MFSASFNPPIAAISVTELAERMTTQPGLQLIDVREPDEVAIVKIDGFVNLPLSQFANWSGQIQTQFDPHAETIVLCHHGVRSAQMCQWLQHQGFTCVKNVTGGIEEYAAVVDSTLARY
ncbi:rhodanese-like domain-containing protein [Leptolyngbya sp. 7M]|uniref:rhodanese-like domain-containing protein n=1 Tax=Leptolyngbya sp. 7M TaxID=2812896 RepID=UPI001B8BE829|nr:rhodanese-like domain-containing protein [Leptolyngbya sp. 7M]QYO64205.1 rhodanese [Leptolyngbya sp. 7M]